MMYKFKNSTMASLGKFFLLLFFLLALSPVNAANHAISASNFTMLSPGTGGLVGGATDVNGNFDDTKICNTESCTDFGMTLASDQPFFGVPWFAHDIRVFSEGTYTFDSSCTAAEIQAGITNCAADPGPTITLVVGPGQLGAHILFDYAPSADIDVVILWDLVDAFGDPIYDGCGPTDPPGACDPAQTPTKAWNLVSRDGDSSGIRGFSMVDGPFVGFEANFNLDMTPPFAPNPSDHAISSSNFTMLSPGTGGLVGGATDVNGNFNDTKICDTESCTDFGMTLASDQPFFGVPWFAHDIRVFSAGNYTFDSSCTAAEIEAGITNCAAGPGPTINLVVAPGQLGAHILFDYNPTVDIDVVILWDLVDAFGDPIYDGCGPTDPPGACDPAQTPTKVWNLVSRDGDGSGIRGFAMVDGPFVGFEANFNLDMLPPFAPSNTPPIANDDNAGAVVNTPRIINVVANDRDGEDGNPPPTPPAFVTITQNPGNGGVTNNGDGTVTYTPNAAFLGIDTFQYTLTDSGGEASNTATVTVTVLATANTPPAAGDASLATDEDTPLDIAVDSVATDGNGDNLTYRDWVFNNASAQDGTVTVDATGTLLTYTPAMDFSGQDTFTYQVTDGVDDSNVATITVTVNPVNDPLECTDVAFNTGIDIPLGIDVAADLLSTCTDIEGDTITLDSFTQPIQAGSSVTRNGDTLTYTPAPGFSGQDSFTYTASDGTDTDTRTVIVDVGLIFGNFTMLDADGVTFGGTNDLLSVWDGTLNTAVSDANFNMEMGSNSSHLFFGFVWTAHHIQIFGPGTYTFDTSCSTVQVEQGLTDCGGSAEEFATLTVGADQIGAHMLFDWNVTANIDVLNLYEANAMFTNPDPRGALYQGAAGPTPALDCLFEQVSIDGDGDTVPGIRFIDGPFIGFRANFNHNFTRGCDAGEIDVQVSTIKSSDPGGCTLSGTSTTPSSRSDLWLMLGFIALLGTFVIRRKRLNGERHH